MISIDYQFITIRIHLNGINKELYFTTKWNDFFEYLTVFRFDTGFLSAATFQHNRFYRNSGCASHGCKRLQHE